MTDESINLSGGARRAVAEAAAEARCFDSWVGVVGGLLSSWVSTSNGEFSSILTYGTFERYWSRNPVLINRHKFRQIVDRLFTEVLYYKSRSFQLYNWRHTNMTTVVYIFLEKVRHVFCIKVARLFKMANTNDEFPLASSIYNAIFFSIFRLGEELLL